MGKHAVEELFEQDPESRVFRSDDVEANIDVMRKVLWDFFGVAQEMGEGVLAQVLSERGWMVAHIKGQTSKSDSPELQLLRMAMKDNRKLADRLRRSDASVANLKQAYQDSLEEKEQQYHDRIEKLKVDLANEKAMLSVKRIDIEAREGLLREIWRMVDGASKRSFKTVIQAVKEHSSPSAVSSRTQSLFDAYLHEKELRYNEQKRKRENAE